MKRDFALLGLLVTLSSLGCNGQVEVLTSGENSGGAGGAGGFGGNAGTAGSAGTGTSGSAGNSGASGKSECALKKGRCQSPDLPCGEGETWGGYALCGEVDNNSCCLPKDTGTGGAAGTSGGAGSGNAGTESAGTGGGGGATGGSAGAAGALQVTGCDWFEQMKKTGAGLKGAVRYQAGGAKAQELPLQTDDKPSVDALVRIVSVTDEYVFAIGSTGNDAQALVALKLDPKTGDFSEFDYLDGGAINVLQDRSPYSFWSSAPENHPHLYYTVPEGNGVSLRRVSRIQPGAVETLATELTFDTTPNQVIWSKDPLNFSNEVFYLGAMDRITQIKKAGTQSLQVGWAEEFITGFTVEGSSLFYGVTFAGTTEGALRRTEIDAAFGFLGTESTDLPSMPGQVISFPDSGEAPAVAVVTRDGIFKLGGIDGVTGGFLYYTPPNPGDLRLSHLEYGIHPTEFGYGYFLDIHCGNEVYAPAFWPDLFTAPVQPSLPEMRADEPGFPFVANTPWAGPNSTPNGPRQHGNKFGIYVIQ